MQKKWSINNNNLQKQLKIFFHTTGANITILYYVRHLQRLNDWL